MWSEISRITVCATCYCLQMHISKTLSKLVLDWRIATSGVIFCYFVTLWTFNCSVCVCGCDGLPVSDDICESLDSTVVAAIVLHTVWSSLNTDAVRPRQTHR